MASFQFDLLLCSETVVSNRRQLSELLIPGVGRPSLVVPIWDASGPWDRRLHMCEMDMGNFANPNFRVVVTRCWYLGFVVLGRTSTCSVGIATLT